MQLHQLKFDDYIHKMTNDGLCLDLGVGVFRFKSHITSVQQNVYEMYADYNITEDKPADFHACVKLAKGPRHYINPQVHFESDVVTPFLPLPKSQAFPLLEWGMNWCLSAYDFNHFILHAGVIANQQNEAFVFPAPPGSGKSTLTAFLAYSGWRLLSDELAIVTPDSLTISPFVRPVCLKNNSIKLVKDWFPQVKFTDTATDTTKGDVAHFKPPANSVKQINTPAQIKAIIFPRYMPNVPVTVFKLDIIEASEAIASNSFNHNVLGEEGFKTLVKLVENVPCVELQYSDVNEVATFLQNEEW
ncbi:HprK-related kinase A [Neptunicella marina]|uniref:HprK-related kinase A n=1 Tax=Neptunicella marina TaxID=2125989 RepID=A0A8J6IT32_9ALTE|nr:HprK-related kinase A [Neptunicella marina]MBC3765794.1 HprK-related kinase A [Neptunicella marina]